MHVTVEVSGLESIQAALGKDFAAALDPAVQAVAEEFESFISPYPPATEANRPRSFNSAYRLAGAKGNLRTHRVTASAANSWYERGYGGRWVTKSGAVHGRQTSQRLGIRWTISIAGPMRRIISNIATYSRFVHSAADQASFHGVRGWRTDKQAAQMLIASGDIQRIFGMLFRRLFGGG